VSMERTRPLALSTGIGVVAVGILGALLIPPLGARGGAVAAVLGDAVFCACIFAVLWRAGPGRELPRDPFVRLALSAVPAALIGAFSPLPAAVDAPLAAAAFLVVAWFAGAIPEEIRARLSAFER
jgi:O-antigen/teichoic acid export membrane protein